MVAVGVAGVTAPMSCLPFHGGKLAVMAAVVGAAPADSVLPLVCMVGVQETAGCVHGVHYLRALMVALAVVVASHLRNHTEVVRVMVGFAVAAGALERVVVGSLNCSQGKADDEERVAVHERLADEMPHHAVGQTCAVCSIRQLHDERVQHDSCWHDQERVHLWA